MWRPLVTPLTANVYVPCNIGICAIDKNDIQQYVIMSLRELSMTINLLTLCRTASYQY